GHSALPAPTKPTAKVQIVSTQPELPVRCCTTQANAIRIASESAMVASPPRNIAMQKIRPKPVQCRSFAKYVRFKARFELGVPPLFPEIRTTVAFFGRALCHSVGCKQAFVTDDTGHAVRRLAPLRHRHRIHTTVLTQRFPGADAGFPGAVHAGGRGALQA